MNAKIYNGNIQPNHKEYKIWVNDEGLIKTWNGTGWVEQSGTSDDNGGGSDTGGGSGESSSVRYFNVTPLVQMGDEGIIALKTFPGILAVKTVFEEFPTSINPMVYIDDKYYNGIISIAILDNFVGFVDNLNSMNSSEPIKSLLQQGLGTEITKEEFYNLEA